MTHQHPLPMTPVEAIEAALIVAGLALQTARTPTQRRHAMDRLQELKRERALIEAQEIAKGRAA